MFRALFVKELREVWWLGLLPLAAMVYAMGAEMEFGYIHSLGRYGFKRYAEPNVLHPMPFSTQDFAVATLLWGGLLAAVLGLWQIFRESHAHTWHFLLHRPISRELILGAKIASGAAVYGLAIVLPMLALIGWAAIPGTHASPVSWSLTFPTLLAATVGTGLYLPALYAGLRRGSLTGTRFWPLLGAAVILGIGTASLMGIFPGALLVILLVWDVLLLAAVRNELRFADLD